jgi:pyruvate dehydrogenase E1 component beta subunit
MSEPRKGYFREGISRAVAEAMRVDPRVIVLGQDVGAFGGAYREFDGLFTEFGPGRVRDTPVAEAAVMGVGVGAAAAGLRPIISVTYMDFITLALDPLVNYAAKLRYKTAGLLSAPVILKTTAGAKGQGVAHSQCLEAWLMNVPGIKVFAPSTPGDAYSLMKAALKSDGPVVFIDHKKLFAIPGEMPETADSADVPAVVRRAGGDFTITTHSYMTLVALKAADQLAEQGVSCEIVELRALAPIDLDTVVQSVRRTGALLTLEEGQTTCGVGAEIITRVQEAMGPVPFVRVGALAAPVSSSPALEAATVPDPARIVAAGLQLLGRTSKVQTPTRDRNPA